MCPNHCESPPQAAHVAERTCVRNKRKVTAIRRSRPGFAAQQQMAKRRMMAEVPKADIIVTNPTHFAVALKY